MEEPTERQPASTSSPAGRAEEAALKKIQITGRDWDMSGWPPEEITVAGIGGHEKRFISFHRFHCIALCCKMI